MLFLPLHHIPCMNPFWPPFSRRLSMCVSLCFMLLFYSPPFLPLLLLSCPFVSWPSSFYCLYFFFLFPIRMMETPLAISLVLSCDNPIFAWRSPCFFISFIWLDIKAEKGYRWRYEPFQYANYVIVQMTLYQYNWVLNYSFLSLPIQYVKL